MDMLFTEEQFTGEQYPEKTQQSSVRSGTFLPAAITKAASKQTYYTIRFLVDRERVPNAYRAYAYFRWVDDTLDGTGLTADARTAFLERQQMMLSACMRGDVPCCTSVEEQILVDLMQSDPSRENRLQIYLHNMMQVMIFDTYRRDRVVSEEELERYTYNLASAVTEAMHYFIGHEDASPQTDERYLAVIGAHVTHMLRDTYEDTAAGYYNVSREFLDAYGISASDISNDAYRVWVKQRVQWARTCFREGRCYLAAVQNPRCRAAGYAYTARFEGVLDAIERENYVLRPEYSERKSVRSGVKMGLSVLRWLAKKS